MAVARLASSRVAPPLAQVWLVHSGEASRRSISPISASRESRETFSRRSAMTRAPGKLAAKVLAAMAHISTPATISAPASRASSTAAARATEHVKCPYHHSVRVVAGCATARRVFSRSGIGPSPPMSVTSLRSTSVMCLDSHSQMTRTRQPNAIKAAS